MQRLTTNSLLFLTLAFVAMPFSIAAKAQAAADPLAGTYADTELSITLTPARGGYTGTIRLGEQAFPLSASATDMRLQGRFTSGEHSFDFAATLEGETLTLQSGKKVYILTRRRTDVAAKAAAVPQADEKFIRLTRAEIRDPMCNNMTASTFLLPKGWKTEGGIIWRWNAYFPTDVSMRIYNPAGLEQISYYPRQMFYDGVRESAAQSARIAGPQAMANAAAGFPEGSDYGGFEVRRQVADPVAVLRAFVIPRMRKELAQLQPVEAVDMPEVAKARAELYAGMPGVQIKAMRVRYAYNLDGRPVEEDFYLVYYAAPLIQPIVSWGMECQSFRAEKGKLDSTMRLFHTINRSGKMDMKWFAAVLDIQQQMQQGVRQGQEQMARTIQATAARNAEMSQLITDSYWKTQRTYDRVFDAVSTTIRGVQHYTDPTDRDRPVDLPSGYERAFVSPRGEIILTMDPTFDPGVVFHEDWKLMPKVGQ